MKKKLVVLILAIISLCTIFTFGACTREESHEHSYSGEWSYNQNYHWHQATCIHTAVIKDKASHDYNPGIETPASFEADGYMTYSCKVCNYEKTEISASKLEHNYSETLTHDNGTTHWYACIDEGYTELKKDESLHEMVETDYDETTGYATFSCVCGYESMHLRCAILNLPSVSETTIYIGQKLSDLTLSGGVASVEGEFVWANSDEVITQSKEYSITFVPTDSQYSTIYAKINIVASQLTITVLACENGTASAEGVVNVNYGSNFTVEFTANENYNLESINVDGNEVTGQESYTFENITSNHTIGATFVEQIVVQPLPFDLTCVTGTQNAYTFENSTLTFTTVSEATVYAISGEFDGNIIIDTGDSYKFDLELTGFTLRCSSINPITVLSGDEVSITAKVGYQNYIYDNREAIDSTDTTLYSAAIYSLVDLEICGKGELTLESVNNNGIHTKDDLQVKNLTLKVTCADNALKGNDSVEITNCTTTLISKKGDCIKTTNSHINETTLNQKGIISILGGTHNLYAACDGIDASYDVVIDDATTQINIYTDKYSSYSEDVTSVTQGTYYLRYNSTAYKYSIKYYNSDSDYLWVNASSDYQTVTSQGGRPGQSSTYYYYTFAKNTNYSKLAVYMYNSSQTQGQDTSYYACSDYKSINSSYDTVALSYSSGSLSVSWTNFSSSQGGMGGGMGGMPQEGNSDKGTYSTKGIKAENQITINQGQIYVQSYDDAIHATNSGIALENGAMPLGNVTINGGNITVYSNDDGVHADGTLAITSGTVNVTNSYEGMEGIFIIISGGSVSVVSSDDGFNGTSTSGTAITISGGSVYVNANGDGIDSNSTASYSGIEFSGGKTVVICNSNGNSAIDTEQGYKHTAGTVLAIMSTGGMTSESTKGNSIGMTTKSSISLTNGGYLTVSSGSTVVATVKMPCVMTAFVVYLGSSGASISSASSTSAVLDSNGVYMA